MTIPKSRQYYRDDCVIDGHFYYGLGDNILLRPFIKALSHQYRHVYLDTPYPELYWDLPNLKFIAPHLRLMAQRHSLEYHGRPDGFWVPRPNDALFPHENVYKFFYQPSYKNGLSFAETIEHNCCPLFGEKYDYELPIRKEWVTAGEELKARLFGDVTKPLVWFHLPVTRTECYIPSRNPEPKYVQALLDRYGGECFFFNFSDSDGEVEKRYGKYDGLHLDYTYNESEYIPVTTLLGLLLNVDAVVTWHSWLMHACIALRVPCLCLWGAWAAPFHIIDDRVEQPNMQHVVPEPFSDSLIHDVNVSGHFCNRELEVSEIFDKFERTIWQDPSATSRVSP